MKTIDIVVRNGRDYLCSLESLPAHGAEVPFDLVAHDGEVLDTARYKLRAHLDKMVEGKQVPVFLLADRVGEVPEGVDPVRAVALPQ